MSTKYGIMFQLKRSGKNPNRPVLVYFHAGGWFSNTGASFIHGPQYLMDQDIVLVVTNYRLGALGEDILSLLFRNH